MVEKVKQWARKLKKQIYLLYFAYKDKRAPWYMKVFIGCLVAYAFSPIDLIPDFIPILGYLDDIIIVPIGIWIALKILPEDVLARASIKAEEKRNLKPTNWVAGILIIVIWALLFIWGLVTIYRYVV